MKDLFESLSMEQINILITSIMADGEIYPGSRRKNNSYREHFSLNQLGYREWKARMIPNLFYLRSSKTYLVSKSNSLFTNFIHTFTTKKVTSSYHMNSYLYVQCLFF